VYVCRALGYAHRQKLFTGGGNVKPINVMLTAMEIVTVVDFGLARLGDSQDSNWHCDWDSGL